jgi:hypothetical protein
MNTYTIKTILVLLPQLKGSLSSALRKGATSKVSIYYTREFSLYAAPGVNNLVFTYFLLNFII